MTSKNKKSVAELEKPKKPLSAYFIFLAEKREELKKKQPDLKPKDITTKIAEDYRALSEEERKEYDKKAKKAKEDYEKVLAKFISEGGEVANKRKAPEKDKDQTKAAKKTSVNKTAEPKQPEEKPKGKRDASKDEKKAEAKTQKKK